MRLLMSGGHLLGWWWVAKIAGGQAATGQATADRVWAMRLTRGGCVGCAMGASVHANAIRCCCCCCCCALLLLL